MQAHGGGLGYGSTSMAVHATAAAAVQAAGGQAGVLTSVIDLASFYRTNVMRRRAADAKADAAGHVVMKLDVEGAEYAVSPALLASGVLCDIDYLFLEMHPPRSSAPAFADAALFTPRLGQAPFFARVREVSGCAQLRTCQCHNFWAVSPI